MMLMTSFNVTLQQDSVRNLEAACERCKVQASRVICCSIIQEV